MKKGSSGVELLYYKRQAFLALPKEQKDELDAWRKEKCAKRRANQGLDKDPPQQE